MRREKVFEEVGAFNANPSQVHEPQPAAFPVQLANSSEQPLDANEVVFRVSASAFQQERAVTTPQIHLNRLAPREKPGQVNAFQNGRQLVNKV